MENTLLVDSDIIIDFFKEKPEIVTWFKENENKFNFATTIINVFELYTGSYKSFNSEEKIKELENFLITLKIFDFTLDCAKVAGKQRANLEKSGSMIEIRDLIIGSIAVINKIPLKTNNIKHFSRIKGLKFAE